MADRWYTAASGNWSTAANWNGGTLPQPGDDVYADGKAVTIDQDVNVGSIRTTQRSGGTAGGSFTCSTTQSITCSGAGIIAGTSGCLFLTGAGTVVTLVSAVTGSSVTLSMSGITISAAMTLNVTGNVAAGSSARSSAGSA